MITRLARGRPLLVRWMSSLGSCELSHAAPQQLLRGAAACQPSDVPRHKQWVLGTIRTSTRAFSVQTTTPMSAIVEKISNLVVGESKKMDPKDEVFVGSIDQGTTSSRFLIFDKAGEPVAVHQEEFKQIYPNPG